MYEYSFETSFTCHISRYVQSIFQLVRYHDPFIYQLKEKIEILWYFLLQLLQYINFTFAMVFIKWKLLLPVLEICVEPPLIFLPGRCKSITSLCFALKCKVRWQRFPLNPHNVHSRVLPKCCISSPSSIGTRYWLISGYWAFDRLFLLRQRNCGDDFWQLILLLPRTVTLLLVRSWAIARNVTNKHLKNYQYWFMKFINICMLFTYKFRNIGSITICTSCRDIWHLAEYKIVIRGDWSFQWRIVAKRVVGRLLLTRVDPRWGWRKLHKCWYRRR